MADMTPEEIKLEHGLYRLAENRRCIETQVDVDNDHFDWIPANPEFVWLEIRDLIAQRDSLQASSESFAKGMVELKQELSDLKQMNEKNFQDYEKLKDQRDQARAALGEMRERRFPICKGPSVPWSALLPYDEQCKQNHGGQDLEKIATRGGLCPEEALAITMGISYCELVNRFGTVHIKQMWDAFADKHNTPGSAILERLRELEAKLAECNLEHENQLDLFEKTFDENKELKAKLTALETAAAKALGDEPKALYIPASIAAPYVPENGYTPEQGKMRSINEIVIMDQAAEIRRLREDKAMLLQMSGEECECGWRTVFPTDGKFKCLLCGREAAALAPKGDSE
jgi:hypothetical protein